MLEINVMYRIAMKKQSIILMIYCLFFTKILSFAMTLTELQTLFTKKMNWFSQERSNKFRQKWGAMRWFEKNEWDEMKCAELQWKQPIIPLIYCLFFRNSFLLRMILFMPEIVITTKLLVFSKMVD